MKPPLKNDSQITKSHLNEYKNKTELSNEIWQIKNSGHHPKVKWEIVKKRVPCNPTNKTLSTMLK